MFLLLLRFASYLSLFYYAVVHFIVLWINIYERVSYATVSSCCLFSCTNTFKKIAGKITPEERYPIAFFQWNQKTFRMHLKFIARIKSNFFWIFVPDIKFESNKFNIRIQVWLKLKFNKEQITKLCICFPIT